MTSRVSARRGDAVPLTAATQPEAGGSPPRKKRGRESAGDMIRSLGLVVLLVVVVWYLAQPPNSDARKLRVVDPTSDIAALRRDAPGIPVPGPLPANWRSTSSTLAPDGLRIGWVTATDHYAEYAASTVARAGWLADISGHGAQVGTFQVGSVTWRQLRDNDQHTTLVRDVAGRTVIVGGVRETTTLDELRTLAAAVG